MFNAACRTDEVRPPSVWPAGTRESATVEKPPLDEIAASEIRRLLESANEQTQVTRNYSQQYYVIPYPMGDVPAETGACTDVVVRAFRRAGIDLQREVHEDMRRDFAAYPQKWGLARPDPNIDHRRVPNLQTFLARRGKSLPVSLQAANYQPGDIVTWDIDGKGMTHIGLVSNVFDREKNRYLIIHNMCCGTRLEDRLFEWNITGHYRYF